MALKTVTMDLQYINQIPGPPRPPEELFRQACSNDEITISTWEKTWLAQMKANRERFGPFKDRAINKLYGKFDKMPVIVAGSGPSLKNNIHVLRNLKGFPIVSVLHNYHYMVDNEVPVSYYVTLDAGPVTIEEVYEGGKQSPEYYYESTKDKTLLAYVGTHPDLLKKWKGEILFFTSPNNPVLFQKMVEIDPFYCFVTTGGNVLGASTYIARMLGCNPVAFVGANFCFDYDKRSFHPWPSKYDGNLGQAMRATDVYGNCVLTWQSYFNFSQWFNWLACKMPGFFVNCTEGGIMGAYPEGLIKQMLFCDLEDFIRSYTVYETIKPDWEDVSKPTNKILF